VSKYPDPGSHIDLNTGAASVLSPDARRFLQTGPAGLIPDEVDSEGRPMISSDDVALHRSPGILTCQISQDRRSVTIGEDYIGPGDFESTGRLEGCSANSPGMIFLADGSVLPFGGQVTLDVDNIVSDAGGTGPTVVMIAAPPTEGAGAIRYFAVLASNFTVATPSVPAVWSDLFSYIDSAYSEWYIIPIAVVVTSTSSGTNYVDDIHWTLETPVISAGGAGSKQVLLKVTGLHLDSPASGVRMYKGDLYANGTQKAYTTQNVTVRIPGIAVDVTVPPSGAWSDVHPCFGWRTIETWTGASLTYTNDTVYETPIPMIL